MTTLDAIAILCEIILVLFIVYGLCELACNFRVVLRFIRCSCEVIGRRIYEWLFDAVTAYYKFKLYRKRRRDTK